MKNDKTKTEGRERVANDALLASLIKDAKRYRALKEKIRYEKESDGMTWAILDWCVDVHSLSPINLDDAIDEILLANVQGIGRDEKPTTPSGA